MRQGPDCVNFPLESHSDEWENPRPTTTRCERNAWTIASEPGVLWVVQRTRTLGTVLVVLGGIISWLSGSLNCDQSLRPLYCLLFKHHVCQFSHARRAWISMSAKHCNTSSVKLDQSHVQTAYTMNTRPPSAVGLEPRTGNPSSTDCIHNRYTFDHVPYRHLVSPFLCHHLTPIRRSAPPLITRKLKLKLPKLPLFSLNSIICGKHFPSNRFLDLVPGLHRQMVAALASLTIPTCSRTPLIYRILISSNANAQGILSAGSLITKFTNGPTRTNMILGPFRWGETI